MPRALVSPAQYKALLKDILALRDQADAATSAAKVTSYWHIGRRIEKLRLSEKAGYHNTIIRDLSADSGLAIRTLHQSLKLSEDYQKPPSDGALTWSHYRALLTLPSPYLRNFYSQKVKENDWSSRQLEAAIKARLHEGKPAKDRLLERPRDPAYLYQAEILDIIDGDTLDLDLDLGFGVSRKLRVRLAVIDCPPITSSKGRKARDLVAEELMQARAVAVKTEKTDIYGRFIAHVFFTTGKCTATECFERGQYLNEILVQQKLADVVG